MVASKVATLILQIEQAGTELGQAQLKLGLDFNQIQYTFGFSIFYLVELVEYILGLTEKIWFGTFWFSVFCSD